MATEEDPAFWIQRDPVLFFNGFLLWFYDFYCIFPISKLLALKIIFSVKFSEFHFRIFSIFCIAENWGKVQYNHKFNSKGSDFLTIHNLSEQAIHNVESWALFRLSDVARWSPCQPIVMYGVCLEYHRSCGPHNNVNHNTQAHTRCIMYTWDKLCNLHTNETQS